MQFRCLLLGIYVGQFVVSYAFFATSVELFITASTFLDLHLLLFFRLQYHRTELEELTSYLRFCITNVYVHLSYISLVKVKI
jgi:hypothetical protein